MTNQPSIIRGGGGRCGRKIAESWLIFGGKRGSEERACKTRWVFFSGDISNGLQRRSGFLCGEKGVKAEPPTYVLPQKNQTNLPGVQRGDFAFVVRPSHEASWHSSPLRRWARSPPSSMHRSTKISWLLFRVCETTNQFNSRASKKQRYDTSKYVSN